MTTYFLLSFYNQEAVKLDRGRLLKLATRDSLTGLYNVGHFKLLLKAEMATLALRRDRNVSLLMIDVDDFKSINDTYGHTAGDTVLREVASIVKNQTRALDVVARYGGEEFIILLPGASVMDAFKVAERMRRYVNEKKFMHENNEFSISISIGITQLQANEKDMDTIIARADKALYEVKQSGKNSAVIASESPRMYWRPDV